MSIFNLFNPFYWYKSISETLSQIWPQKQQNKNSEQNLDLYVEDPQDFDCNEEDLE